MLVQLHHCSPTLSIYPYREKTSKTFKRSNQVSIQFFHWGQVAKPPSSLRSKCSGHRLLLSRKRSGLLGKVKISDECSWIGDVNVRQRSTSNIKRLRTLVFEQKEGCFMPRGECYQWQFFQSRILGRRERESKSALNYEKQCKLGRGDMTSDGIRNYQPLSQHQHCRPLCQ